MALTKRSENKFVYLEAKHHCLWRQIKKQVAGCDSVEVTNPKTGDVSTKYGYRYDSVAGHVVKIEKFDTAKKYPTRYFGFKMHLVEGAETYVLTMPYNSQLLRRFLRVARNVDWTQPLSITIFKGKKQGGGEELGVWFQQNGATVKPYYTREQPHGMPDAYHDTVEDSWDFRDQHRWLVAKLIDEIVPDIAAAAKRVAPPIEQAGDEQVQEDTQEPEQPPHSDYITDDDVPF